MDKVDGSGLVWRKSSLCVSGECIEVAIVGPRVLVRDSAAPSGTRVLELIREQWDIFLRRVSVDAWDVQSLSAAPDDRHDADKRPGSPKVRDCRLQ